MKENFDVEISEQQYKGKCPKELEVGVSSNPNFRYVFETHQEATIMYTNQYLVLITSSIDAIAISEI